MKKVTYIVAALALASSTAMASKARRLAIANSTMAVGGVDVQEVFTNPHKVNKIGDLVTLEAGATAATGSVTNSNAAGVAAAEGGFIDSMGDSKLTVYLGRDNSFQTFSNYATGTSTYYQVNPLDIIYASKAGDFKWGAGLYYANFDVKSGTANKGNAMGVSVGTFYGPHSIGLVQGLGSSIELPASGVKGTYTGSTALSYSWTFMETGKLAASYSTSGYKKETNGTENKKYSKNTTIVGYEGKKGNMFYGVQYSIEKVEDTGGSNTDTTTLPLWFGVEADATSWLVLRGSVKQNVLLGSTKVSTASETDTISDNTVVALGTGIKFDKFMLDGSLATGTDTNGKFGLDANFMFNTALTYNF